MLTLVLEFFFRLVLELKDFQVNIKTNLDPKKFRLNVRTIDKVKD